MPRPVTMFTGQWADLTPDEIAPKVRARGYDGLEMACWGDLFSVDRALKEDREAPWLSMPSSSPIVESRDGGRIFYF